MMEEDERVQDPTTDWQLGITIMLFGALIVTGVVSAYNHPKEAAGFVAFLVGLLLFFGLFPVVVGRVAKKAKAWYVERGSE